MAIYSLLFGHAEWPEEKPHRGTVERELEVLRLDSDPIRRMSISVPDTLKRRVEASASLEGVPADAWIERALTRSVDPRVLEVS
jgi:hypothetical protein